MVEGEIACRVHLGLDLAARAVQLTHQRLRWLGELLEFAHRRAPHLTPPIGVQRAQWRRRGDHAGGGARAARREHGRSV